MRCYNGAPDRELQQHLDRQRAAKAALAAAGWTVVYFPADGWGASRDGYTWTTEYYDTVEAAAAALLKA